MQYTKYHYGSHEKVVYANGTSKNLFYIFGATDLAGICVKEGSNTQMTYAITDHLGSIWALANEQGQLVEEYSYDPWGKRVNPDDWTQNDTRTEFITDRGFTLHEHFDAMHIIYMNARLYDPLLGQFISVDPLADKYPGLGAYVYCANNPLMYIDPTGEAYVTIFENGKAVKSYDQSTEDFLSEWFDNPYHRQYLEDNCESYEEDFETELFSILVDDYISKGSDRNGNYTAYHHSISVKASNYTFGIEMNGKVYGDKGFEDPDRITFDYALTNASSSGDDVNIGSAYWHYKFGEKADYHVDISKVDWSMLSVKDFPGGVGSIKNINIFSIKPISTAGAVFGDIRLQYLGNNQIKAADTDIKGNSYFDTYNYNVRWGEVMQGKNLKRNIATGVGWIGVNMPWHPLLFNTYGGDSYKFIFHGTGTIEGGR